MMRRIWAFFTSARLAIVLTLLITIDVLAGAVLLSGSPQVFGTLDLEIFFPWLLSTGLDNLAVSWWIFLLLALLILFSLNTIICTVDSIAHMLRARPGATRARARRILSQVIHVGFVIGLTGHLVSSASGFRTMNNRVPEGQTLDLPQSGVLSLRLNKLDVVFDGGGAMQKMDAYISLMEDAEIVREQVVRLNEPLLYQGNAVYITHHGEAPDSMKFRLSSDAEAETFRIGFHAKSATSSTGYTFRLGRFITDFVLDSQGAAYSASENFRNPAQEVKIYKGQKYLGNGWFLLNYPERTPLAFDGLELVFTGLDFTPYAVLTINKDPGAVTVLSGALIFLFALIALLFIKGDRMELVRR